MACWASSSAAFWASAALRASAAALWDVRAGVDELLGSVTLAVAITERLGLDPDGSWPLLSILAAPESADYYESMKCIVEREKNAPEPPKNDDRKYKWVRLPAPKLAIVP